MDLHVVANGVLIRPVCQTELVYTFVVPIGATQILLKSRSSAPTETRPWLEDRRRLGVAVSRLTFRSGSDVGLLPIDGPDLSTGWWSVEKEGAAMWRWTNGNALIRLPPSKLPQILEVKLGPATTYALASDVRPPGGIRRQISVAA
jgi:hypothetical protein